MRIGIMTYWQTLDNYGQVLQCYALQRLLKDMGHKSFIIRYDLNERPEYASFFRHFGQVILYPIYQYRQRKKREIRWIKAKLEQRRGFDDFRKKHLCFSNDVYSSLKELKCNAPKADCYIAGSDQLWGQLLYNPENEAFFLNFGEERVNRIAFAVSYGMKDYPIELRKKLRHNLMRFHHISCRERDGVAICKSVGVFAERVIDPTLVCELSGYDSLIEPTKQETLYVFIYSINIASPEDIRYNELIQFANKQGWGIVVTVGSGYFEGREIYDHAEYSYATVGQWLFNIKNASLVVTSSFHGIVFCILFHRPFIYIPLQGNVSKSNNRVLELLDDLGLNNHVLSADVSYKNLSSIPFFWEDVDERLQRLRSEAKVFLIKALEGENS